MEEQGGLDADGPEEEGPWPARCEWVAAALAAAGVVLIAGAVVGAVALKAGAFAPGGSVSAATRVRYAAYQVGPFNALVVLAAIIVVAIGGITSGEERGPVTPVGRAALWTATTVAVITLITGAIRVVDVLAGNAIPGAHHAGLTVSSPEEANELASVLLSAAAVYIGFAVLGDDVIVPDVIDDEPDPVGGEAEG